MRIALFSDIHGNVEALKSILDDINKEGIKETYFLGDAIGIGPNSRECLDIIMNSNVKMILGNHELYFLYALNVKEGLNLENAMHNAWVDSTLDSKHLNYLERCPLYITFGNYYFSHFLISDDDIHIYYLIEKFLNGECNDKIKELPEYCFFGHNHKNSESDILGHKVIILGSSGCTNDNHTSYYILDTDTNEYYKKVITYDRDLFVKKILSYDYPNRENVLEEFFNITL